MVELIIQIVTGAVGGNVVGGLLDFGANTGPIMNTIMGVVGGGLGGRILSSLGANGGQGNFDPSNIGALVSNVGGSFLGGGVLLSVVKFVAPMLGLGGSLGF